jgi:hypothetical protein
MAAENRIAEKRQQKERTKARKASGESVYVKAIAREEEPLTAMMLRLMGATGARDSAYNHPMFPIRYEVFIRRAEMLVAHLDAARARFLIPEYSSGLVLLLGAGEWRRPLEDWKPKGRGKDTQFRSLIEHLLCEYPVPHFLYQAFHPVAGAVTNYNYVSNEVLKRREWLGFFAGVGRGLSAVKMAKAFIKMPMTKRMVHRFMQTTGGMSLEGALRWVQITEFTDDPQWARNLHRALMGLRHFNGEMNHTVKREEFWQDVVRLLARQTMLDPAQVGPLVDYIQHCKTENADWSMKGRTIQSLTTGMEQWHNVLNKIQKVQGHNFQPAGFSRGSWRVLQEGRKDLWWHYAVGELLSTKKLADEGRGMKHCVYSYARSVEAGRISIWSLRRWPCHKVEVYDEATEKMRTEWADMAEFDRSGVR